MTGSRILITGGNGYVGRTLARLLYDDHQVCVADSLRLGRVRFAPDELAKIRFDRVDITDAPQIARVIADFAPDIVVHLAAIHYIPECEEQPGLAVRTNVAGTVNVLLAAPAGCRLVFASSGAVYRPEAQPHAEATSALDPSDVYGLSKLHGEHYVQYLARQRGLRAVAVRLFNVVGPGETNPHLLPEIVAQLKAGRSSVRLGNLSPKRDYIHVADAAGGFRAAALAGHVAPGETVVANLGTGQAYSVEEVVRRLRKVAGIEFAIEQESSRMRQVDRPFMAADIGRIQRLFGWRPRHTLDDALVELWQRPELTDALMAKYR